MNFTAVRQRGKKRKERQMPRKKVNLRKQGARLEGLCIAPFLVCFLCFFIFPLFLALYYTFVQGGSFAGLKNYSAVFQSAAFRLACWNTLRFILVGVSLLMACSLGCALLLYRNFWGSSVFKTILLSPLVIPVATVAVVIQTFFSDNGIINMILAELGELRIEWIQSHWAFALLVLLYLWKNIGYITLLILSGLHLIPRELNEAAAIDGAAPWQVFARVTLPLLRPNLCFAALVSVSNSFKSFKEAYLLGGDIPDRSIYMLQHFLNNNFNNANYSRLSIAAITLFVVISFIIWVIYGIIKKGYD